MAAPAPASTAPRVATPRWPGIKPGSGNDRVLNLLADGRWHTTYEIQVGLEVTSHSRLAELRGLGYSFAKRRVQGATGLRMFEWKMVGRPLVDVPATGTGFDPPAGVGTGASTSGTVLEVLPTPATYGAARQLSLLEAA